jgi:hypothetical protein
MPARCLQQRQARKIEKAITWFSFYSNSEQQEWHGFFGLGVNTHDISGYPGPICYSIQPTLRENGNIVAFRFYAELYLYYYTLDKTIGSNIYFNAISRIPIK